MVAVAEQTGVREQSFIMSARATEGPSTRIALSGKAGSGKTTLAKRLTAEFGFQRMSFASRLRKELAELLDISEAEFEIDKARWRGLMQEWGAARRYQSEGYWVRRLLLRVPVDRSKCLVVDDLRYQNEAQTLKRERFVLVRLVMETSESVSYLLGGDMPPDVARVAVTHPSETDLDNYDGFDIRIDAPRSRSLDDIYAELVEAIGWQR